MAVLQAAETFKTSLKVEPSGRRVFLPNRSVRPSSNL